MRTGLRFDQRNPKITLALIHISLLQLLNCQRGGGEKEREERQVKWLRTLHSKLSRMIMLICSGLEPTQITATGSNNRKLDSAHTILYPCCTLQCECICQRQILKNLAHLIQPERNPQAPHLQQVTSRLSAGRAVLVCLMTALTLLWQHNWLDITHSSALSLIPSDHYAFLVKCTTTA